MTKTMQQAVKDAIKFFTDNKREFSAHDVTNQIRQRVNSNEYEIDGISKRTLGGISTQVISHIDVRDIFKVEVQNVVGYYKQPKNGYYNYTPDNSTQVPVTQAPTTTDLFDTDDDDDDDNPLMVDGL